ncbi:hypothetical protein EMN47_08135 [Prolixibacteraceae bacterium JC049]|nr:hypothetical protein [Prolixibacteraceae bacterium JC049]
MRLLTYLSVLFFLTGNHATAQIGTWQDHFSFNQAFLVEKAQENIYVASPKGLFYYNTTDNSVNKLTKAEGLSDVGISAIAYNNNSQTFLIGYSNSNVDFITTDGTINLPDIKRKNILGDRSINNILMIDNKAYLSCGFGIVLLNMEKKEVTETYYIGDNGASIAVYDMAFDGTNLYAATEQGVYYADYNEPNLLDFTKWHRYDNLPDADSKFSRVTIINNRLLVCQEGAKDATTGLPTCKFYMKEGSNWNQKLNDVKHLFSWRKNGDNLIITQRDEITWFNSTLQKTGKKITAYSTHFFTPRDIYTDGTTHWIADWNHGLVSNKSGGWQEYRPAGPNNNNAFTMLANGNDLWIVGGGRNSAWNNIFSKAEVKHFDQEENNWQIYNDIQFSQLASTHDFINVAVDPADKDHIYCGSWSTGLYEFNDGKFVAKHTSENTNGKIEHVAISADMTRIGGVAFDKDGQLWLTTSEVANNKLVVRKTDGSWDSFRFTQSVNNPKVGNIIVTQNNHKWIQLFRDGVYVIGDQTSDQRKLRVKARFNGSDKVLDNIQCMVEDLDGKIWLGTTQGVVVYTYPSSVFSQTDFVGMQPSVDNNDDFYHPLLSDQTVTAIAIDGANRKWLGTEKSGVYLVSADGTQEIKHFTTENSLLPSDRILSIAVNDKTGDVFFGTQEGIVSYDAGATKGNDVFQNVYAYPNPVREDYKGLITITGLVKDTNIKITDVSGNLVYETTSLGGKATWDGLNAEGKRAATGVYLVFAANKDGSDSAVTKILFIH